MIAFNFLKKEMCFSLINRLNALQMSFKYEHWEAKKLKYLFRKLSNRVPPSMK